MYGTTTNIDLEEGTYTVHWYDPRNGGDLQIGSIEEIKGGGKPSIGYPPDDIAKDWAVLIRKKD